MRAGPLEGARAGGLDDLADAFDFVGGEVVHHYGVALAEGWRQDLAQIGPERLAVHRAIQHPWSLDPVAAQAGNEGQGLPVAMGDCGDQPLALWRAPAQARHVGLHPAFIEEDQARRVEAGLRLAPFQPGLRDVGTLLFGCMGSLFLNVSPCRFRRFQTAP